MIATSGGTKDHAVAYILLVCSAASASPAKTVTDMAAATRTTTKSVPSHVFLMLLFVFITLLLSENLK